MRLLHTFHGCLAYPPWLSPPGQGPRALSTADEEASSSAVQVDIKQATLHNQLWLVCT